MINIKCYASGMVEYLEIPPTTNDLEIWKDIEGFEGIYQISNKGNLKSFKKNKNGRILKNKNKKGWYLNIILTNKKKKKSIKIHKLVALAFIPNPNNYPVINHINGNKQDNRVENLEWCTQKQNIIHAKQKGLWKYNKPYKCKKILQFSLNNDFISIYENAEEASRKTNVCSRNILMVANKEPYNKKGYIRKQAGGFIWRFYND